MAGRLKPWRIISMRQGEERIQQGSEPAALPRSSVPPQTVEKAAILCMMLIKYWHPPNHASFPSVEVTI
jgi:hypothetical protein